MVSANGTALLTILCTTGFIINEAVRTIQSFTLITVITHSASVNKTNGLPNLVSQQFSELRRIIAFLTSTRD